MKLFLVQHGEQTPKDQDPLEPLSKQGIKDVKKVSSFFKNAGITVDEIFHSVKLHAKQTAEIFAKDLLIKHAIEEKKGLKPMDDIVYWLDTFEYYKGNLMLVGHLPFMTKLASFLLAHTQDEDPVKFQQGGVVCLEKDNQDEWSLLYAITPELL